MAKDSTAAVIDPRQKQFGELLKLIRKQLRLTQNDLAELVGLSQTYIARIEAGQREPSFDLVSKIAALGNCEIVFSRDGVLIRQPSRIASQTNREAATMSIGEFLRQLISEQYPTNFKMGMNTLMGFCPFDSDDEIEIVRALIDGQVSELPDDLMGAVAYGIRGFKPGSGVTPDDLRRMQRQNQCPPRTNGESKNHMNGRN